MKNLTLLIWLTQLGLSVVCPLTFCVLLAVWLHERLGWGVWVIWAGAVLGTILAIDGLRSSLKIMARISRDDKKEGPPPLSFNEHS